MFDFALEVDVREWLIPTGLVGPHVNLLDSTLAFCRENGQHTFVQFGIREAKYSDGVADCRGIEVEPFKKALNEAGVKNAHHVYPGAGHAFLNDDNPKAYNKEQAAKAWKEINDFLKSELK